MLELSEMAKVVLVITLIPFLLWLTLGFMELSKGKKHMGLVFAGLFFVVSTMFYFLDNEYMRYDDPIGTPVSDTLTYQNCPFDYELRDQNTAVIYEAKSSGSPFVYKIIRCQAFARMRQAPSTPSASDAVLHGSSPSPVSGYNEEVSVDAYTFGVVLNLAFYVIVSMLLFGVARRTATMRNK